MALLPFVILPSGPQFPKFEGWPPCFWYASHSEVHQYILCCRWQGDGTTVRRRQCWICSCPWGSPHAGRKDEYGRSSSDTRSLAHCLSAIAFCRWVYIGVYHEHVLLTWCVCDFQMVSCDGVMWCSHGVMWCPVVFTWCNVIFTWCHMMMFTWCHVMFKWCHVLFTWCTMILTAIIEGMVTIIGPLLSGLIWKNITHPNWFFVCPKWKPQLYLESTLVL